MKEIWICESFAYHYFWHNFNWNIEVSWIIIFSVDNQRFKVINFIIYSFTSSIFDSSFSPLTIDLINQLNHILLIWLPTLLQGKVFLPIFVLNNYIFNCSWRVDINFGIRINYKYSFFDISSNNIQPWSGATI